MKKILSLGMILGLGACVYGNPVNYEKFYGNTDITKIDWSKVDGQGSACQTNWFFGLLPLGDNSVPAAIESAEIAKVAYIDTDTSLYLPLLMTRECTNVWGELTPSARAAMKYNDFNQDEDETDAFETKPKPVVAPKATAKAMPKPVIETKPEAKAVSETKAEPKAVVKAESKSDYEMPAANKQ
jgi:hypothetical protein